MTITSDALAMSYASAGYTSFDADLAHLASDPFDLAHLASTATFGAPSGEGDEDADEDESAE